jgi:transcriptional regulator of heat shock response|tara:strand:- start:639 stop:1013 length:375 start_codon:yes stop_codon:yes gene_type:complete
MQYIFIIALLGSLGGLGYKMYTDTMNRMQSLANEKAALEVKFQEQKAAMERQLEVMKLQEESLADMNERAAVVEAQMKDYLKIFKDHDLTRLARAKPGMIETRANKRTDEIFTVIENDTKMVQE